VRGDTATGDDGKPLLERVLGGGRRGHWRRRVLRRAAAALCAAAAVSGTTALARTPVAGPGVPVVVATRDLPTGALLGPGDLRATTRPSSHAPAGPLPSSAELAGQVLAVPVAAGEVLTTTRVVGASLLAGRPPGEVALHVEVADPGAAAMVGPGDVVDVLSSTGGTLAPAVTVLAGGGRSARGPGALGASGLGASGLGSSGLGSGLGSALGGGPPGSGLVVAVTPEVAARLWAAPRDDTGATALTVVLRRQP
jgi:Flp pilus assembly protein CpaB